MSGLNLSQVKDLIVTPVLQAAGTRCSTLSAINLVLGAGNVESGYIYVAQLGNGPARGFWQMEKPTHDDILDRYLLLPAQAALLPYVKSLLIPGLDPFAQLIVNSAYACIMCRMKFLMAVPPLPASQDAAGMAAYHKQFYNSVLGKTVVDAADIACFTAAIAA
jgi:hypothetical protein